MQFDRRLFRSFDWALLGYTLIIPLIGLVVLYSASYDPDSLEPAFSWLPIQLHSPYFTKQCVYLLGGLFALLVASTLSSQILYRLSYFFYGLCILLLIAVDITGVIAKGSQRWLSIGGLSFQPSEMMKLALILALAHYLSKNPPRDGAYKFIEILIPFSLFLVPMALIMGQPDLGTALSIGIVGLSMVAFMGIRMRSILIMGISVALAVVPIWNFVLHPYQKRRVMVLFNPEADPLGSGYHIIQSKIAVGSGELFGKGFLKGTQTQLEFLPEHRTDFIFSVLSEEWGFFGATLVLALYALLIFKMLRIVVRGKDLFSSLLAFGVGSQIFFNSLINVGMVIGLLPVVGIPLPLFSYGGTSLISTMFSVGIVMGVSMRRSAFTTA